MPIAIIVDDNNENLYLLRCLLSADGYDVIEASSGSDALTKARQRPVDVIVSDILMPGMDGFSLCREWKADSALQKIPFVFYTATYTDSRDEAFARSLGADEFIVKPTDPSELRQRIRKAVTSPTLTPSASNPDAATDSAPFLKEYNEVLIRKLEDKLLQLDRANQTLLVKDFALASSESGVLLSDAAGLVTYANLAMQRLYGNSTDQLLGKNIGELFTLPSGWEQWVTQGSGGQQFECQLRTQPASSKAPYARIQAHRIVTHDGQFIGIMLSCVDMSEERRLRDELARVHRLDALGLFAAGVAHDFNNLLMAIYASLDLDFADQGSPHRLEFHDIAIAAFERAKDLTKRLLTFSKGGVSKRLALNLGQLVDECIALALSGSGVACIKHYEAACLTVNGDSGQLAQVFSNLFVNARQAMKDTGTLVVSLENRIAAPGEGSFVVVRVADDGSGIPADVLPQIFEPYFTTKTDGTGLGLATCHTIVHAHGGRITVSSEVGQGTSFEVWLPATTAAADAHDAQQPSSESPRGRGRILVMDDQVTIQALLQRTLERAGYSVVVVGNGEQALMEYARAAQAGAAFELLILDITIRGAMGGIETLQTLRQRGTIVPAIASTGYSDDESIARLRAHGFAHVLGKPFLMHELLSVTKALVGTQVTAH